MLVNAALGTRALRGLLLSVAVLAASVVMAAPGGGQTSPAPVDLGTADPFAILAGTEITDSPTSAITGDVGLWPGTGAAIGLTCPQVNGTIYDRDGAGDPCFVTDDPLLDVAKQDLEDAFDDAAGRTPPTEVGTELGGTTKTPGVYDSANTRFGISAPNPLILDAQGDPNGVFIFQMAFDGTGLTVGPGSEVQLTGGAQACNVFWQLNTATIDTTAVFKGNILALNSITVNNGADIEGRLLARNGNVTLINDTITRSDCATPPAPSEPSAPSEPPTASAPPAVPGVPRFTG